MGGEEWGGEEKSGEERGEEGECCGCTEAEPQVGEREVLGCGRMCILRDINSV